MCVCVCVCACVCVCVCVVNGKSFNFIMCVRELGVGVELIHSFRLHSQ